MRRPAQPHVTPTSQAAADWADFYRAESAPDPLDYDAEPFDPRPLDERTPHIVAGWAFLLLASLPIVGGLWAFIVALDAVAS